MANTHTVPCKGAARCARLVWIPAFARNDPPCGGQAFLWNRYVRAFDLVRRLTKRTPQSLPLCKRGIKGDFLLLNHKSKITNQKSQILLILFILTLPAFAFDFVQERESIPVSFDGVECQVPWTTGYDYVQPTFCDIDGDNDLDLFFGSGWRRLSFFENIGTHLPL